MTVEAVARVADGRADEAVVMCWTGTGASLAANKVAGIRAALCHDAETARGARVWNHANVLALSLRATPMPIAREILDAWFSTPYSDDDWNLRQIGAHPNHRERRSAHLKPAQRGWSPGRPRPVWRVQHGAGSCATVQRFGSD